jgi:hypothetical protein
VGLALAATQQERSVSVEPEPFPPVPSQTERDLCRLVDNDFGQRLTWDKRAVGVVAYNGQRVALRHLTDSQVVALLIERKRRQDAGERVDAVDAFLNDHGFYWRPFEPPHKRAEHRA